MLRPYVCFISFNPARNAGNWKLDETTQGVGMILFFCVVQGTSLFLQMLMNPFTESWNVRCHMALISLFVTF